MTAKRRASSLDALFDVASEAMEVTKGAPTSQPTEGLHLLSIKQIRPDLLQARRILPPAVRVGFVSGQLDPAGALAAWRAMAEDDPNEAGLLQETIIGLASSIKQQDLVNPVTVCPDGHGKYLLETGERRWWAHWWLVSVEEQAQYEKIRAQVVLVASPERQAAENLQDSPLSAVQEACQVARLLLHLSGRDTDHVVAIMGGEEQKDEWVGFDLYRAALELERGDVYGKWPLIAQIMGRGERQLLRQLAVLKLDDEVLNQADRVRLTEGQLRPLVSVAAETEPERQRRIVSLISRYDLSGAEVTRLVKTADLDAAETRYQRRMNPDLKEVAKTAAIRRPSSIMVDRLRGVRRFAARQEKGGLRVTDLVSEILASEQALDIFKELDDLTEMLVLLRDELSRHVR